jgi:prepilin-type processing-associated H-X9-DG protein
MAYKLLRPVADFPFPPDNNPDLPRVARFRWRHPFAAPELNRESACQGVKFFKRQAAERGGDMLSYCHLGHFWSFHSGGGNWLLADGSVAFMTCDAGESVIPEMAGIK